MWASVSACSDNMDMDVDYEYDLGETLVEFGSSCALYIPRVQDDGICTEVVLEQETTGDSAIPDQVRSR